VIEGCTDVVVVCSKGSLDRCINAGDWVRMEIAHALKNGKNVVPVMLRGFEWPDVLPDDIEELRMQNGVNANSAEYFDAAVDRLASKFLQSGIALLGKKIGMDSTKTSESTVSANAQEYTDGYITIKGKQYSTSLTELDLREMGLQDKDIVPLQYMKNLTKLTLGGNQISDLTSLSNLINLTELNMWNNQISNLTQLSELTNLTKIDLCGNQISDLTPLCGFKKLTWLLLDDNQINDITPLSGLTKLTVLGLRENQISNLTPLSNFKNFKELYLHCNPITDWSPVAHITNVYV